MNRSASDPGLAAAPRQPPEPQGLSWRNHMQSVLFVAEDSGDGGLARWWPFRFAHQQSGVLAFEPLGGGAEFFVNADWRQPFVAGPCRPVPVPADLAGLLPQNRKAGAQLYPFTLSYAPVPDPSQRHQDVPPRRSILLAAADSKLRAAWLANFSHKASAPELRHAQPPAKRVVTHSSSTSKLSGGSAAALLPHQHLVTLGHEHAGLPAIPATDARRASGFRKASVASAASLRLSAGCQNLWEGKPPASLCRHSIVRDLLDGYAADPLSAVNADNMASSRPQTGASSRPETGTSSRPLTGASRQGASRQSARRESQQKREVEDVFQRYIRRQAQIETLLREKLSGPPPREPSPARPPPQQEAGGAEQGEEPPEDLEPLAPRLELAARTVNAVLDGDVLTVEKWSGGGVFRVPNERAFRLAITPLHPLGANPLFLGVVPPSTDLARVNFFDAGTGVLLCLGGQPSSELISALGEPGGPAFYAFGERRVAGIPTPEAGQSVSVTYLEDEEAGCARVRFVVSGQDGEALYFAEPQLPRPIPLGWLPCVLLCVPGTRVRVKSLY